MLGHASVQCTNRGNSTAKLGKIFKNLANTFGIANEICIIGYDNCHNYNTVLR